MGKVVGGMTFSLDGYVADATGNIERLYPNHDTFPDTDVLKEEIRTTGAIIMGRTSFDMADPDSFADSYEYQVPIFVMTHHPPAKHPKETEKLTVTFLEGDIADAVVKAKAAAGDKNVLLIGVSINQQIFKAGLCDELHIGIMPVMFGGGLRFFENFDVGGVNLEKFRIYEAGARTDIWFKVVK